MTPFGVDKKSFGQRIRSLRTLNKWTREQLGRRTNLNSELIRAYEAGKAFPKPEGLVSLSSILSVPIEWLLTGVGDIQLSTATKERTPVEEMIAETQATISRNTTAWGVRLHGPICRMTLLRSGQMAPWRMQVEDSLPVPSKSGTTVLCNPLPGLRGVVQPVSQGARQTDGANLGL